MKACVKRVWHPLTVDFHIFFCFIMEFNVQVKEYRNDTVRLRIESPRFTLCSFDHISYEDDAIGIVFHKTKTSQEGSDLKKNS